MEAGASQKSGPARWWTRIANATERDKDWPMCRQ
uniref:Uncharacterized protein n=1 Tax=Anopheles minimus TaxID=112268 RepID=A0A182WPD0_9DIPT